jgi:hypothetical protein
MSNFQQFLSDVQNQWTLRGKRKAKIKPHSRQKLVRAMMLLAIVMLAVLGGMVAFIRTTNTSTTTTSVLPPADLLMETVTGTWTGTAVLPDGRVQTYEVVLRQDGISITGEAYSEDNRGNMSAYLNGSYEDGWLTAEESGGSFEGWNGVCYWSIELQTTGDMSAPSMTGVFHRIPNEQGTCTENTGTVELVRQ